jgi:5'-nucleotidase
MAYDLDNRLVVGVASSALFDLRTSDSVFRSDGEEAYRAYQEENLAVPLDPGVAFPFVKRLLSLNDLSSPDDPLTEVIILSKNDPDTGLRAMRSVAHHQLPITRSIFMQGRSPYKFMSTLNMSLFLSADAADVRQAVALKLPAGQVLESTIIDDADDELRIAFDFDGVLAGDQSEQVMQADGIEKFHQHEVANMVTPHDPGPLHEFLASINKIQKREEQRRQDDPSYSIRLRVSLVTARNAPSHERRPKVSSRGESR